MSEHTPGAWTIERTEGGTCGPHWLIRASNQCVGHFYDEGGACPNGGGNARLIAAAPDLLNAAMQALSDLQWLQDLTPETDLRSSILLLEHAIENACPSPQPTVD